MDVPFSLFIAIWLNATLGIYWIKSEKKIDRFIGSACISVVITFALVSLALIAKK